METSEQPKKTKNIYVQSENILMPISKKRENWYGDKESTEDCQIFSKKKYIEKIARFSAKLYIEKQSFRKAFFLDSPHWIYPLYT